LKMAANMDKVNTAKYAVKKSGDNKEGEDDDLKTILSPNGRAQRYYERAKTLYTNGGGTSTELELVLRDVAAACAYKEDHKNYYFLAKVFKQCLDYSSCIYSLRNVMHLAPNNKPARAMLAEVLFLKAKEIMGEACVGKKRLEDAQEVLTKLLKRKEEMRLAIEAAKKEKEDKDRAEALEKGTASLADIVRESKRKQMEAENNFGNINKGPRPPRIPAKVKAHVQALFRTARVYFDEALEYDRDNYEAHMFKATCHVSRQRN